jgi:hypothetical protein
LPAGLALLFQSLEQSFLLLLQLFLGLSDFVLQITRFEILLLNGLTFLLNGIDTLPYQILQTSRALEIAAGDKHERPSANIDRLGENLERRWK